MGRSLADKNVGSSGTITNMYLSTCMKRRLLSMGLLIGKKVEIINKIEGSSIIVSISDMQFILGIDLASNIWVE